MSHTLTRRGLVAAAPAAVVAAAVPAIAGAHPDAALLALREPYERTLAVVEAAGPAHTLAEDSLHAAKTTHPDLDAETLERMTGFDVADARWQAVVDANSAVILQIIEAPARTLEGLIFKADVCERECFHCDLAEAIVSDLVAMGGAHA